MSSSLPLPSLYPTPFHIPPSPSSASPSHPSPTHMYSCSMFPIHPTSPPSLPPPVISSRAATQHFPPPHSINVPRRALPLCTVSPRLAHACVLPAGAATQRAARGLGGGGSRDAYIRRASGSRASPCPAPPFCCCETSISGGGGGAGPLSPCNLPFLTPSRSRSCRSVGGIDTSPLSRL